MSDKEDIGFLKAKAESASNQLTDLFKKGDEQAAVMSEIHTILKVHVNESSSRHDTIEENIEELEKKLDYCKKGVDDHYTLKRFGMILIAVFSTLWAMFWKFIGKITIS